MIRLLILYRDDLIGYNRFKSIYELNFRDFSIKIQPFYEHDMVIFIEGDKINIMKNRYSDKHGVFNKEDYKF